MTERELETLLREGILEKAGLFYSVYPAIVKDTNDPEKRGRIKVLCPERFGNKTYKVWIPQRNSFAGKGIGIFAMPNIGDGVDISFRGGNIDFPMWEYRTWIKGDEISESKENYPDKLVIKRGDLRIELDTKTNKVFIGNDDYSLNEFFTDLMTALLNVKTSTMLGPQPFINLPEFTQIKTKIENILS